MPNYFEKRKNHVEEESAQQILESSRTQNKVTIREGANAALKRAFKEGARMIDWLEKKHKEMLKVTSRAKKK